MSAEHREHTAQNASVEPELIARAARGDRVAFSQIYASSAPGVRRYVRTIIWNAWDAEDVTQEVFVKIFVGLSQYDPDRATFSAWTLRVARNAAIDHMRRARRRGSPEEIDGRAVVDDTGRRCRESLREVLGELSESQREVLVLRALGGFTPREVATHSKASRGSVNTLYHRARVAARDRLKALDAAPCTRRASVGNTDVISEAA
jgi:RNA polymerase sigma-70 factor (ECF subfamily)